MSTADSPPLDPPNKRGRGRRVLTWVLGSIAALLLVAVVGFLLWANIGVMAAEPGPLQDVKDDPAVTLTDAGGA